MNRKTKNYNLAVAYPLFLLASIKWIDCKIKKYYSFIDFCYEWEG